MEAAEGPIGPVRFGDFQREIALHQQQVSYNELTRSSAAGRGAAAPSGRLQLRRIDVYRLLAPYLSVRFWMQVRAVMPLAVYLALFQLVVLRQEVSNGFDILAGILAVILGLMLFMEGLALGVMPFAEAIGNRLPKRRSLPVVLIVAFILGVGATFAEPAIGALQAAGSIVDAERAPYLHAMLNERSGALVLVVGIGVGVAAILGTIRFLYGWSLKPLIYLALVPTLGLTAWFMTDDRLASTLGLAWDCGGITTGPITVPLVLALGIGIAAAAGKNESSLSGFGIVTLASLFPVLGVMLLALWVAWTASPQDMAALETAADAGRDAMSWIYNSPGAETVAGLRAILPLVAFLYFVMRVLLRERLAQGGVVAYGITLALLGLIIFNLGLTYGLSSLGGQSGGMVPAAFTALETVFGSPLYPYIVGIAVALLFAWFLGFGATLAEPALNALGTTVESLTNGAFRKRTLMYAVSTGVAFGLALGVAKITFELSLGGMLLPLYGLAVLMTIFSSEEFVNIAWDSAGVTTGPVTVPLVLALGLSFGNAMHVTEGFGILAMASICPIIAVLAFGLILKVQASRRLQQTQQMPAEERA